MFNLESSVAGWREQMLAAGIDDPGTLDELENHLHEEWQRLRHVGFSGSVAFELATRQIGRAQVLKTEFARAGGNGLKKLKQLVRTLAGIPDYQLAATYMNTSNLTIESRWATYLKALAFVVPGILFWMAACVFVAPKMKAICAASGTAFPGPILTVLALSDLVKNNLIIASLMLFTILATLEWRSHGWPRYRRMTLGIVVFLLNIGALVVLTAMLIFAVIGGANLLHPAR